VFDLCRLGQQRVVRMVARECVVEMEAFKAMTEPRF
jgi:hypothetical protein